jgi:hypothetical protein
LEERWPWFAAQLEAHTVQLNTSVDAIFGNTDPRPGHPLSAHELLLPDDSSVGMAILQYFYTLNLITPLQLSIPILVSLMLFGKEYDLTHLRALVVHAFHGMLGSGQVSAAIVYEAATLGHCIALQTRALKMMMNVSQISVYRLLPLCLTFCLRQANAKNKRPNGTDTARRLQEVR